MSAQKQCPKCGEKNPAEAVMCWACYTSLTGGVAAPVGAGAAGGAAALAGAKPLSISDSGEKKKIEPKHLAIIGGLCLLGAVGFGATQMMGGSSEDDQMSFQQIPPAPPPPKPTENTNPAPASSGSNLPPVPSLQAPDKPGATSPTIAFPYKQIASPNSRIPWATMGIVPATGEMKEAEAKGLAAFAHNQLNRTRKFPAVEIYVFNKETDAQAFANFQSRRRGAQLSVADYQGAECNAILSRAIVRYLSVKGKQTYSSPQSDPMGFWKTGSRS